MNLVSNVSAIAVLIEKYPALTFKDEMAPRDSQDFY